MPQSDQVVFDRPIQKLIEIVARAQKKMQIGKPARSELARRHVEQVFSLSDEQWSCYQSWQPYLAKVLKECSPMTHRLQQLFQV